MVQAALPIGAPPGGSTHAVDTQRSDTKQLQNTAEDWAARSQQDHKLHLVAMDLKRGLAREAAAVLAQAALQSELEERMTLIEGLTQQLEVMNTKVAQKDNQIEWLKGQLKSALQNRDSQRDREEDDAAAAASSDSQGTIEQLITRVAELEEILLQATSFAPPATQSVPGSPSVHSGRQTDGEPARDRSSDRGVAATADSATAAEPAAACELDTAAPSEPVSAEQPVAGSAETTSAASQLAANLTGSGVAPTAECAAAVPELRTVAPTEPVSALPVEGTIEPSSSAASQIQAVDTSSVAATAETTAAGTELNTAARVESIDTQPGVAADSSPPDEK